MKKSIVVVALVIVMVIVTFTGCGEIELLDTQEILKVKELPQYGTSKEDYLKDIEMLFELLAYAEYNEDDVGESLIKVKQYTVFTKEGTSIKNAFIELLELSQKGIGLGEQMTADNYENILEKMFEVNEKIDKIMNQDLEKLVEDLLLAAKEAGVDAEELQSLGFDF